MARRRAFLAAAMTSLLAACGVNRAPDPDSHWAEPDAQYPAQPSTGPTSAAPSPSPSATSSKPRPTGSAGASASASGGGGDLHPSKAKTGPAGSLRLTGSDGVALTFDDGPDPQYTPQLLDLLRQEGVQATFSMIGSRVRDFPDVVKRVVAEGHNLSNHSWQHLIDLGKRPLEYQQQDLRNTLDWMHTVVPDAPVNYFRAPGGNFTPDMVQLAGSLGMRSIYWDVDTRDWDAATWGHGQPMVDHIVAVVKGTTRPGSIILSHDRVRPDTIAAYRLLLPWLKAHFRLVRLP
jgi:peptidoglycan/xylan/chitin deacetylase (PgdA/CDA1 family)